MFFLERGLAVLAFLELIALTTQTNIAAPDSLSDHEDLVKRSSTDCQDCCGDVCLTEDCLREAAEMTKKINLSADPCDNFAEFACGRFYKEAKIPDNRGAIYTFTPIMEEVDRTITEIIEEEIKPSDRHYLRTAKIFYKSCMDTDAINKVGYRPYLSSSYAAEWPTLVGRGWKESANFSLADLVVRYAVAGTTPLFEIFSHVNTVNNSVPQIFVLPRINIQEEHHYYLQPRNSSFFRAYEAFVKDFAIELGADPILAAEDAVAIVDFQVALSKIKINKQDEEKHSHEQTLASLYQNYSWIGFPQALRAVYDLANVTLEDDEMIMLRDYEQTYFPQLPVLLENYTERDFRNLFSFHYAIKRFSLTEQYTKLHFPVTQIKTGAKKMKSRSEICVAVMNYKFKHNIAREFIRRKFPGESKAIVAKMAEDIRDAYYETLQQVNWMANTTKQNAIEKLLHIKVFTGYPDSGYSDDELDKRFEKWQFTEDQFYRNCEILDYNRALEESRLLLTFQRDEWEWWVGPTTINARYMFTTNSVYILAGILQPTQFSRSYSLAHNYGSTGIVIGHEFGHAFDPSGSKYDKFGNVHNWWDADDRGNYTERTRCFVDQYENFTLPQLAGETGFKWDGERSKGEITGDNNGLRQSYRAYRKLIADRGQEEKKLPGLNLTPDQLFFLAYGQTFCEKATTAALKHRLNARKHAALNYRIVGVLQNFPEFAQAYNCPLGSRMNPEEKCILF